MKDRECCGCQRCRTRGLMGPVLLVTLGVLILAGHFTRYSFGELWPIIFIVIGVIMLAASLRSKEGHVGP